MSYCIEYTSVIWWNNSKFSILSPPGSQRQSKENIIFLRLSFRMYFYDLIIIGLFLVYVANNSFSVLNFVQQRLGWCQLHIKLGILFFELQWMNLNNKLILRILNFEFGICDCYFTIKIRDENWIQMNFTNLDFLLNEMILQSKFTGKSLWLQIHGIKCSVLMQFKSTNIKLLHFMTFQEISRIACWF